MSLEIVETAAAARCVSHNGKRPLPQPKGQPESENRFQDVKMPALAAALSANKKNRTASSANR